jgi:ABC-type amino acid transport substrate-binding protein
MRALAGFAAALALCVSLPVYAGQNDAGPVLTVCLNKDYAPFSFKKEGVVGGYDYLVAQGVAKHLGKTLDVKWYEKERRSRGAVSVKTSVLINAEVCQLVGGYPFIQSSLDRPAGEATTLPPVEGMPPESRKQSINGSQLIASQPYHFAALTVVFGKNVTLSTLQTLDELKPYKIGNRPASLGDLLAMAYKKGLLTNNAVRVDMGIDPLDALAKSEFDVTIIEAHKFDIYRQENPATELRASGLNLPVGLNLGFVTTAEHSELLTAVNAALTTMQKNGEIEKAAREAGLTYIAPLNPAVRNGLGLEKLIQ